MYVVGSSTRSHNLELQVVRDTNQVSVELLLQFNRNPVAALFGAENAMYKVCGVRMRHSATLNPQ
jgi:hypothetical protein